MTIIILTNCPAGLRGFLTRWLMEISPGVFIGGPSARIGSPLGRGPQVRRHRPRPARLPTNNEQGFTFETRDHKWHPVDHEGLTLIRRPKFSTVSAVTPPPDQGWSKASKRRRYGKR